MHNACPDSQQITEERTDLCTRSNARNHLKRDFFKPVSSWYDSRYVFKSVNGRRSKWTAGRMRRPRSAAMLSRPVEKPKRGTRTAKGNTDANANGLPARSKALRSGDGKSERYGNVP